MQASSVMQTATQSTWMRDAGFPGGAKTYPTLAEDRSADVVVIGAGITGLTTALLLARSGLRVLVVERDRVASGTTSRSTAHLTSVLDVSFEHLVGRFGEDAARTVVESSVRAIDEIERLARAIGPHCAFRRVPGYRFSEEEKGAAQLPREAALAASLGLVVQSEPSVPLSFACHAIRFDHQAELDPIAYVRGLAELASAAGAAIFEHSPVVETGDDAIRIASGPRVSARHVIEATHTPVGLVAAIQTRLAAMTSYVLEARIDEPLPPALFWDTADPYHYVRAVGDGRRILVGGEDHGTGRERDPFARFAALETWTRARFPVASIEERWSHELFQSADGLPYVGLLPGAKTHWVAAGFSGTGLTFGTAAALALHDLVTVGASPWEAVYSPRRLKPLASAPSMARENLEIGWRFVADRLRGGAALDSLAVDSGRVERVGRKQVAVYRDLRGDLHLLSARCPHLGCIVGWNDAEKTWDCPCHGGRFAATGKVLYGPPVTNLAHESASARPADEVPEPPAR